MYSLILFYGATVSTQFFNDFHVGHFRRPTNECPAPFPTVNMAPPSSGGLAFLGIPAEVRNRIYDFLLPLQVIVFNLHFRGITLRPDHALDTFLSVRALCRTTYDEVKPRRLLIRYYVFGNPFDRPPLLSRFCLSRVRSLVLNICLGTVPELLSTRYYDETSLPLRSWIQLYQTMSSPGSI